MKKIIYIIVALALVLGLSFQELSAQSAPSTDITCLKNLIKLGKRINLRLNEASMNYSAQDTAALEQLNISIVDYQGNPCTGGSCRIKRLGKDYLLNPVLNYGGFKKNFTRFLSYTNTSFGEFTVYTHPANPSYKFKLSCYQVTPSTIDPNQQVCVSLGQALGANNSECSGSTSTPVCMFN
ncbi:MAG: hypothetical protein HN833_05255 [Elusimicrobiaceae bacterium]|mgnify:FL=1|nr:hypothetical protein [Elusimicrobiaceae bacterium]MBT3955217.1 hypothetical protein [Elusimicrobiaceae bacterium]MBT4007786.1 hypothetical protein [Elusimicrobiaceae bacterium]MBT4403315.1 hypothetical protein [Elusimicrobiaceae bacterium]MBT4440379.1 hypothetical protein [Elusimicrobiaceae bacterium]